MSDYRPQVVAAGTRPWQGIEVQVYRGQVVGAEGQIQYTCGHRHPDFRAAFRCAQGWIERRRAREARA